MAALGGDGHICNPRTPMRRSDNPERLTSKPKLWIAPEGAMTIENVRLFGVFNKRGKCEYGVRSPAIGTDRRDRSIAPDHGEPSGKGINESLLIDQSPVNLLLLQP